MNGDARMAVLLLKETKHILAAATQPPDGSSSPTPESLAGAAFPLRLRMANNTRPPALVLLPPSVLEAKLLPLDARVLARPLSFAVNGGIVGELPNTQLSTGATLAPLTVAVTANLAAAPDPRKVLVAARGLDADYPEQRIQTGCLAPPATTLTLPLKITPDGPETGLRLGEGCAIIVAVAGLRLACFRKTVS
ncbi:MAG: hypothetical protein AB7O44_26435 [Hyphomicrobiaceae bacterium]